MTVKTIINAVETIREAHTETCMRLQQVRDEMQELRQNGQPVGISLKDKERALSDRKVQLAVLINELMDARVR